MGIAILRHNLFDIDRIIHRTLVYGLLSACLGATYLACILLLGALVRSLSGQSSDVVTAVSTLAVAGLFQPLRHRIQSLVDRRFYRRKYDAMRVVERFGARIRDEVDLVTLGTELQAVAVQTMQPAQSNEFIGDLLRRGRQQLQLLPVVGWLNRLTQPSRHDPSQRRDSVPWSHCGCGIIGTCQ
jgi:hypothetical protein